MQDRGASNGPAVIVVGAGIVGASIGWHLARRGARVTVVDCAGAAAGATGRAFGWLQGGHGGGPVSRLRELGLAEWRRLGREVGPGLGLSWPGALVWGSGAATGNSTRALRPVSPAAIARLAPGLLALPARARFAPADGALIPALAVRALIADAGLTIERHRELRLRTRAGRVVGIESEAGTRTADIVVLAAGTGSTSLAAAVGVPLAVHPSPALLLRFRAPVGLLRTIVSGPAFEARQLAGGDMLAAEDLDPRASPHIVRAVTGRAVAALRRGLGAPVSLRSSAVGWRPMPDDGLPVIGPAMPGLYAAVMHSGVTLGALAGRLAAQEILDGHEVPLLSPFRPSRFR